MFTGIVQATGRIAATEPKATGCASRSTSACTSADVAIGDSIASTGAA
jgi:riboflavin synthase alpha subunit